MAIARKLTTANPKDANISIAARLRAAIPRSSKFDGWAS